MDYDSLLKKYRREIIASPSETNLLTYEQNEIKKLIPHREPFLLIDKIMDIDTGNELIIGSRKILEDDPIFKGHFPDFPVYPGSLQLEMIGQLGLCLTYFLVNQTDKIASDAKPVNVRATKILGAVFQEPVLPGEELMMVVKKVEQDSYLGSVVGQVISGSKICTVSISEVLFLDG